MLTFTDEDIIEVELMRPYIRGFRQDYTAVILTTSEVCDSDGEDPTGMLFLTKEDLQNLLALFDKEETN
jgi:hypothetical protein